MTIFSITETEVDYYDPMSMFSEDEDEHQLELPEDFSEDEDAEAAAESWRTFSLASLSRSSDKYMEEFLDDSDAFPLAFALGTQVESLKVSAGNPNLKQNISVTDILHLVQVCDSLKTYAQSRNSSDLDFSRMLLGQSS